MFSFVFQVWGQSGNCVPAEAYLPACTLGHRDRAGMGGPAQRRASEAPTGTGDKTRASPVQSRDSGWDASLGGIHFFPSDKKYILGCDCHFCSDVRPVDTRAKQQGGLYRQEATRFNRIVDV